MELFLCSKKQIEILMSPYFIFVNFALFSHLYVHLKGCEFATKIPYWPKWAKKKAKISRFLC